jgi:hypothetical protein
VTKEGNGRARGVGDEKIVAVFIKSIIYISEFVLSFCIILMTEYDIASASNCSKELFDWGSPKSSHEDKSCVSEALCLWNFYRGEGIW